MMQFNYIKFTAIPGSRIMHIPQLVSCWDNWVTITQRTFLTIGSFDLYKNYNETLFLHFYYDWVISTKGRKHG